MLNNFRADLHMHSTWSDGTDSPRELLTKVKGAGISYFAITDMTNTAAAASFCCS